MRKKCFRIALKVLSFIKLISQPKIAAFYIRESKFTKYIISFLTTHDLLYQIEQVIAIDTSEKKLHKQLFV